MSNHLHRLQELIDTHEMGRGTELGCVLLLASAEGQVEASELLIAAGADVNYKSDEQETAFSWACAKDQLDVAKLLYANGADINAPLASGITPLDCAVCHASPVFRSWLESVGGIRNRDYEQWPYPSVPELKLPTKVTKDASRLERALNIYKWIQLRLLPFAVGMIISANVLGLITLVVFFAVPLWGKRFLPLDYEGKISMGVAIIFAFITLIMSSVSIAFSLLPALITWKFISIRLRFLGFAPSAAMGLVWLYLVIFTGM